MKKIVLVLLVIAGCIPPAPVKRGNLGGQIGGGFLPPTRIGTGGAGDITAVNVTGPITGGGTSGAVGISLLSCSASQILKMNGGGTAWACDSDGGGTSYTAGDALTLTGADFDVVAGAGIGIVADAVTLALSVQNCSAGSFFDANTATGVFTCVAEVGDVEGITAGAGLTTGGTSGTITVDVGAGTGITVNANDVAIDPTYTQRRVSGTCVGQVVVGVNQDGTVTCEADDSGGGVSDGDKGDVVISSSATVYTVDSNAINSAKISDGTVALADMANMATASFIGRTTASTGVPEVLSATSATAILNTFASGTKGLVPASGGGTANFIRADGTWAVPTGTTYTAGDALSLTGTDFDVLHSVDFAINGSDELELSTGVTAPGTVTVTGLLTANGHATVTGNIQSTSYIYSGSGGVYSGAGVLLLPTGGIVAHYTTNAEANLLINPVGYNESTGQFRGVQIQDGKGVDIVVIDGSDKTTTFKGDAAIESNLRIEVNAGKLSSKLGQNVTSLSGCGTGATLVGDRSMWTLNTGTSAGTCVITWSTAFTNTPTCLVTTQSATKTYSYSVAAGSLTISTTASSSKYDGLCGDHH